MSGDRSRERWHSAAVRVWRASMDSPAYAFGCHVLNMSIRGASPREIHEFAKARRRRLGLDA